MDYSKLKKEKIICLLLEKDEKINELEHQVEDLEWDMDNFYTHNDDINFQDLELVKKLRDLKQSKEFSIIDQEEFDNTLESL